MWKPLAVPEVSYELVLIDGHPSWSGRARHSYGHLLFAPLDIGRYHIDQLQISHPEVVPHGLRCEGLVLGLGSALTYHCSSSRHWVYMVLPQLDAYHAGRRMQQLQPWESVCLAHHFKLNEAGMAIPLVYNYAAYADVHVVTLCPDGAPILLFSDPTDLPVRTPWDLCVTGDLGSVESNVMAGRALLGLFQLANGGQRCALFVLLDKHICRAATKRPRLGLTGALPQRLWNWLCCLSQLRAPSVTAYWPCILGHRPTSTQPRTGHSLSRPILAWRSSCKGSTF